MEAGILFLVAAGVISVIIFRKQITSFLNRKEKIDPVIPPVEPEVPVDPIPEPTPPVEQIAELQKCAQ